MKVSIITIVFNNVEKISNTIESVLKQDYENIEYIVIDGKSTDGTCEKIREYKSEIDTYVSEKDEGIYDAMNKGVDFATGDIIGFINAGDILKKNDILSKIVEYFKRYDVDVVYGDKTYIDPDSGELLRYWEADSYNRSNFSKGWMPPHLSTYIKKKCYDKWGYYRTDFKIAADYELLFRFLYHHNARAKYLPEVIAEMEAGGISNNSLKNVLISNYEVFKSWRVNNHWVSPFIIVKKPFSKLKQFID